MRSSAVDDDVVIVLMIGVFVRMMIRPNREDIFHHRRFHTPVRRFLWNQTRLSHELMTL